MLALRISDRHLTVLCRILRGNVGPSVTDTHPHRFSKRSRVVFWSCTPAGEVLYAFLHVQRWLLSYLFITGRLAEKERELRALRHA